MVLTSAWIVSNEKFVERCPTAANAHHDRRTKNTNEPKALRFTELEWHTCTSFRCSSLCRSTYSIASFGDLLHVVLLRALTERCLSVHFALDSIDVGHVGSSKLLRVLKRLLQLLGSFRRSRENLLPACLHCCQGISDVDRVRLGRDELQMRAQLIQGDQMFFVGLQLCLKRLVLVDLLEQRLQQAETTLNALLIVQVAFRVGQPFGELLQRRMEQVNGMREFDQLLAFGQCTLFNIEQTF